MLNRLPVAILCLAVAAYAPAQPTSAYPDKLIHTPTPMPDRVILTFDGDPATSQAVTWRTDPSVKTPLGQIAVATDGPEFDPKLGRNSTVNAEKVRTVPATSTPLKSDLNQAVYHSVSFSGLEPKTKYVYRVGDGVNWCEWHQFRTASTRPEAFGFIYFGDAQNDVKRHWSRVARGAYSDMPNAAFIVHAGDLINTSNTDAEWGEWHSAAGWINGTVPNAPTPGNHEYYSRDSALGAAVGFAYAPGSQPRTKRSLSRHWNPQFTLPRNGPPGLEESVYYFDYQGVRFISLNSNEQQVEQVQWLEQVLKDNPHRWSVVTFHHPIYSPAKGRDNKTLRNLWRPVFDKYAVDLVLTGHDHTYGRTGIMREDDTLSGSQMRTTSGTVYCVSVSGPKLYELGTSQRMVSKAEKIQLYQLIHFKGDRLHYEARTAAGELYDEFELRKQGNGKNLLLERSELDAERQRGTGWRMSGRDATFAATGMIALAVGAWGVRRVFRNQS